MSKIFICSDHAGFSLKEELKPFLKDLGHEVVDCGAEALLEGDDYPPIVRACAERVAKDAGSVGLAIGGSGQGEAMVAGKVKGIRCAVFYGPATRMQTDADGVSRDIITSVRVHNDANMLSLGARFITFEEAKEAVQTFLETQASTDERHVRRRQAIG